MNRYTNMKNGEIHAAHMLAKEICHYKTSKFEYNDQRKANKIVCLCAGGSRATTCSPSENPS